MEKVISGKLKQKDTMQSSYNFDRPILGFVS